MLITMPDDFLFVKGVDVTTNQRRTRAPVSQQHCVLPVQRIDDCSLGSAKKEGDVLFIKGVDTITNQRYTRKPV
jgi:hypothetical protein